MTDAAPPPLEWRFSQVFGDKQPSEEVTDADVASAVEFDDTGDFLATGDRGGRIVVFERNKGDSSVGASSPNITNSPARKVSGSSSSSPQLRTVTTIPSASRKENVEYRFYAEFQSHESEFDCLKSLEIEEKINQIKWLKRQNNSLFLLSTNDKTIKLWKIHNKKLKQITDLNNGPDTTNGNRRGLFSQQGQTPIISSLKIPSYSNTRTQIQAVNRKTFGNSHAYHVNSISPNTDGETFVSADDLRINLWNLNCSDTSFNIVDIKPANMEELTEVITSAEYHSHHCNIFMYASSRGTIRLCDMRAQALCDKHAKMFEEEEDPANKSFFSEIISSISDCKFSRCGRYIMSRDYLTLKIWDIHMESRPVKTIHIHEHLRSKLCDLYENDCIFDKFESKFSGCGNYVTTGSYHNNFHIYDRMGRTDTCIEASKVVPKKKSASKSKLPLGRGKQLRRSDSMDADNINFSKKILHMAWHPHMNLIAVCALNNLYIYVGS